MHKSIETPECKKNISSVHTKIISLSRINALRVAEGKTHIPIPGYSADIVSVIPDTTQEDIQDNRVFNVDSDRSGIPYVYTHNGKSFEDIRGEEYDEEKEQYAQGLQNLIDGLIQTQKNLKTDSEGFKDDNDQISTQCQEESNTLSVHIKTLQKIKTHYGDNL